MKKIFLLTLLLFSFLLIGCNNTKNVTNTDTLVGINKPTITNISKPSLILDSNSISTSPYIYLGNLVFFPDKENNNRLSTIETLTSSGYIQQSNIKDIFQYSTESIATINNTVYFSNGSDGNSLYSLDYEGNEIKKSGLSQDEGGKPAVAFELTDEGSKKFSDATKKFLGQPISITIDGEVISSPNVESQISGGSGVITSSTFTVDTAQDLALQIESGALPVDLQEIEVRSISATLGVNALQNSVFAGMIGLIILFLFMLIYYRLPGLTACLALVVYICFVMLLLGSVPGVQLTLPGIAGIILGIGMAVDANVIIFERFKEEFRTGKSARTSFKAGFQKAFITILDSNITTLICAVVLAVFGAGQIKSFAYTLIISIIVSMISALLVTRGILQMFINLNIKNPNVFMSKAKAVRAAALEAKNGGNAQ
ncbi:MAG: protein translocase subunit SecD [Christensenellaceae bacterium]